MSIRAKIYLPPNGEVKFIDLTEINEEDEAWFVQHEAKLSFEQLLNGQIVAYADIGLVDEDGEPEEAIEISWDRSCRDTMADLRVQCEGMLSHV